jgi:hypothetical protein
MPRGRRSDFFQPEFSAKASNIELDPLLMAARLATLLTSRQGQPKKPPERLESSLWSVMISAREEGRYKCET